MKKETTMTETPNPSTVEMSGTLDETCPDVVPGDTTIGEADGCTGGEEGLEHQLGESPLADHLTGFQPPFSRPSSPRSITPAFDPASDCEVLVQVFRNGEWKPVTPDLYNTDLDVDMFSACGGNFRVRLFIKGVEVTPKFLGASQEG